jgi:hypothetical protein
LSKLDPGAHHGVLTEAMVTESKGSKSLQMEMKFSVYEGIDKTVFLSLTDSAREAFVDETLRSLGFNGDFETPKFREDLYTDGVDLWLKYETYEGKEREKWGISNGGGGTPAPADKVKRLSAQWKSKNGAPPKPAGRPTPPPAGKAPAKSGPPPKAEKPFGKDEAWERAVQGSAPNEVDTAKWQAAIDEIGDEDEFTEADWKTVAAAFIPF